MSRRSELLLAGFLSAGLLAVAVDGAAAEPETASAAWARVVTVLQHPRCLNCHRAERPLRGDARRRHVPAVSGGDDGSGAAGLRCGGCHNAMGNDPTSGTPGGPRWQLPPRSMAWDGLTAGELCRAVRDPARNGGRGADALVEHADADPLVLWAWHPGAGRAPVPLSHARFVGSLRTWTAGGMPCPE